MSDCIECGRELFGRCDKKFCSDGCRNSYNNRIRRKGTEEPRRINRVLEKKQENSGKNDYFREEKVYSDETFRRRFQLRILHFF